MNKKIKKILILLFWIVIWAAIAAIIANNIVLAGPIDVITSLCQMAFSISFWVTIGLSLLRITIGFLIASFIGCGIAFLSYKFKLFHDFINPLIQLMKSAPIVCFIVLLLLWVGTNFVDIITIIITVTPVYFFAIYEACQNRDINIINMLKVYKVNGPTSWRIFEWPNALPYFNQATKTGIGLAWKSGVTAQMIGAVRYTIGEGVFNSKLYLDSAQLLVWMFIVILLGWVCEKIIILLINKFSGISVKKSINIKNDKCEYKLADDACIILANISKSYKNKLLFSNLSYKIDSGQKIAITNKTGSGKTTLINIILGLENPDKGEVLVKEYKPHTFSVVFQNNTLLDHLSVNQNISIIANKKYNAQLIDGNLLANELSGGMKRCVEIERALASKSQIVILDEPFTGLDSNTKEKAIEFINNNLDGRGLILITHNKNDAIKLNCTIQNIIS